MMLNETQHKELLQLIAEELGLIAKYAEGLAAHITGLEVLTNTHAIIQLAYDSAYKGAQKMFPDQRGEDGSWDAFDEEWESALEWISWREIEEKFRSA